MHFSGFSPINYGYLAYPEQSYFWLRLSGVVCMIFEFLRVFYRLLVMKNTVLILGHSFIVRLRRFVHSAEHAKVNLNLSVRVLFRGYTGCTIDRIAVRGLR